jgi:hypothetical protein
MDVREAISIAKQQVAALFSDEGASNVGLEEVFFHEPSKEWRVTIGFSRPWNTPAGPLAVIATQSDGPRRTFKVIRIDDRTGALVAIENREPRVAA